MNTEEFIKIMDSGAEVIAMSEAHMYMTFLSNEAMKITAELPHSRRNRRTDGKADGQSSCKVH